MIHRNQPMTQEPRMIVGGTEGTFVDGAQLKPVDTLVETLIGFANGAVNGAVVGAAVSGLLSMKDAQHGGRMAAWGNNLAGKHLLGLLAATTALGVIGAIVRNSRARMHNQWRNEHYQFLEHQEQQSAQGGFAGREDARRTQMASAVNER